MAKKVRKKEVKFFKLLKSTISKDHCIDLPG